MKDRVVFHTSIVLAITVALFAWFTWARWGVVGIYPVVGRLVVGAAVFALACTGLFSFSRHFTPRARSPAVPIAPQPAPEKACQEAEEKTKVTTAEMV